LEAKQIGALSPRALAHLKVEDTDGCVQSYAGLLAPAIRAKKPKSRITATQAYVAYATTRLPTLHLRFHGNLRWGVEALEQTLAWLLCEI